MCPSLFYCPLLGCLKKQNLLPFLGMDRNTLKKVWQWVFRVGEMFVEVIVYIVEILAAFWFLTVILAFILLAWYLGFLS